ncbi:sensor histidine kinase [Cohnella nanjingensis]|uniref:histidine kinase n=1 Tax=Cohnella nanjingensis TaxID=1387779 RepID=A0A7X0RRW4_9BACL|nr:sensor histidine kinase [Cohnella nanjingensis]MBB6672554.1 sensor histidine kinase [Cohnella nanjingensis]
MRGTAWRIWRALLRDRLVYMLAYAALAVTLVAVLALRLADAGQPIDWRIAGYMLLLTVVFLTVALAIDHFRRLAFERRVRELRQTPPAGPEKVLSLPEPDFSDQLVYRELLFAQYHAHVSGMAEARQRAERRHLFTQQWVHQMKTPVSVIDLLTQQSGGLPSLEEARETLRSIREENGRIEEGLETVLYQARLDQFDRDLRLESVSLRETARAVVNRHKHAMLRASVYPQLEGEDLLATTDAKWLAFMIGQLISNAIKYSRAKPGAKRLLVAVAAVQGGCELCVADEGVGIAEEDLPRVAEPFFTGRNGRMGGESTGMGLYLVQETCALLGHRLAIESQAGAGTTVRIFFRR